VIDFSVPCESFEQACAEVVESMTARPAGAAIFDGCYPIGDRWRRWLSVFGADEMKALAVDGHGAPVAGLAAAVGRLDAGFICQPYYDSGLVSFFRVSDRSARASRGQLCVHPNSDSIVRIESAYLSIRSGRWRTQKEYLGMVAGRLMSIGKPLRRPVAIDGAHAAVITFAESASLIMRYEWSVRVAVEGHASVALPVERDSCAEIFRLRDAPAGKTRRAALLNFVTEHWKRSRSQAPTEDPQVFVREHLRGQTKFSWDGLKCEVVPPKYDVERLK